MASGQVRCFPPLLEGRRMLPSRCKLCNADHPQDQRTGTVLFYLKVPMVSNCPFLQHVWSGWVAEFLIHFFFETG